MAGTSIIPLPQWQDDGWVEGEFDNGSADDETLSPPSPRIPEVTPNFEQLRQFDAWPRSNPTQDTIHRPVPRQPRPPTGFPLTCSVEMASNNLDASRYQEFLPHRYPLSPQNTPPEERIHLPCPVGISSSGPSPKMMGYRNLDRSRDQEFPMLHYPLSPQNTPTQELIHLPVPGGSQPRSSTGSPLTRRREMTYPSLLYQEFHSIQFCVSAQNSPTQQLGQLPRQPGLHRHELTLSPIRNLENLPGPYQTTGVNRTLLLSGPIQQPSRNPGTTFGEHAILHPTLQRHGLTLPTMLNLDRPDAVPMRLSYLETLTLAPYRVGMVAGPTTDRIVTRDGTEISTPTLPRLASLDDITSARERGEMDSDSMGSDSADGDSMDSDFTDSDSMYSDFMDWDSIPTDFIEGGSGSN